MIRMMAKILIIMKTIMVLDLVPSYCNNKCSVIDTINDKDDSKDTSNHKT